MGAGTLEAYQYGDQSSAAITIDRISPGYYSCLTDEASSPHFYRGDRLLVIYTSTDARVVKELDGSPHAWPENRGPTFTLLLAVDDATGTVPAALFQKQEDTLGYLPLVQEIVRSHGIPLAVYMARHTVFQHSRALWAEEDQTNKRIPTQFAHTLQELGVTQILAHSPQAKGRVERVNGTFQDRLVRELRLARAATIAEANAVLAAFLPRFNACFGVPAAQPGSAYRSRGADLDLAGTLCIKHQRRVAKDNTVLYQQHALQLFPTPDHLSYAGATVEVQERLDGQLVVCF